MKTCPGFFIASQALFDYPLKLEAFRRAQGFMNASFSRAG